MTKPNHVTSVTFVIAAASLTASVVRAQTVRQESLDLEGARVVLHAAEEKARAIHKPSCISIVDVGGHLLLFERMEGAWLAGDELALGKARSAAIFGKPTAQLEDTINGGRIAAVTAGAVEMQGGVPVTVHGVVVGAIGVSGSDKEGDVPIAEAGSVALSPTADKGGEY